MIDSHCFSNCDFNFTCGCCGLTFSCLCNLHKHLLNKKEVDKYCVDLLTSTVEVTFSNEINNVSNTEDSSGDSDQSVSATVDLSEQSGKTRKLNAMNDEEILEETQNDYVSSLDDIEDSNERGDVEDEPLESSHMLTDCEVVSKMTELDSACKQSLDISRACKSEDNNMLGNEFTKKVQVPCDICGHMFKKRNLKRHKESHTELKHYSCDTCKKGFKTQSQLYNHKLHHNKEKSYTCHVCGKSFNNGPNVRQHIKIHTRERTLKCPVCSKLFTSNYILKDHLLRHSDEKPYQCSICGQSFRKKQERKRHMTKHSDSRDHECSFCNKKFKSKSNRLKHEKIHKR